MDDEEVKEIIDDIKNPFWYIICPFCCEEITSLHSRRRAIIGLVSHAFACSKPLSKEDWLELYEEIQQMDFEVKKKKEDETLKLYKEGEISTGKAAELLDMNYDEFLGLLKEKGIKKQWGPSSVEEAEKEIETIREIKGGSDHE